VTSCQRDGLGDDMIGRHEMVAQPDVLKRLEDFDTRAFVIILR
jgi:hypothetical protein